MSTPGSLTFVVDLAGEPGVSTPGLQQDRCNLARAKHIMPVIMRTKSTNRLLGCVWLVFCGASVGWAATIDLRPHFDQTIPLANPHKGWYHHLFDNHINKYQLESDEDLLKFPGMDHIYLRLAWAYLQPREDHFDWEVIDRPIRKWTAHGLGVAFRISCKETSVDRPEQQFATPRWVRDCGAKGEFDTRRAPATKAKSAGNPNDEPKLPWRPDYADPIFLEKLDRFLAQFAARYDGKPWVRYMDIGSFGEWGEGHTGPKKYGFDVLKAHVDLHLKHFRRTQLVVSDDLVMHLSSPDDQQRLFRYLIDNKVSFRDDSILVDWYIRTYPATFSVRNPNFFAEAARSMPTVLELEHYPTVIKQGNWTAKEGSTMAKYGNGRTGADFFRGAVEQLQATYIGYHGYARTWLKDNPQLTVELLNRCGYWFFPESVEIPDRFVRGRTAEMKILWRNRGVARAYFDYQLVVKLEGPAQTELRLPARNTRWLPGPKLWPETYALAIPENLPLGQYQLKLKLYSPQASRDVKLPLKADLADRQGFYAIGRATIAAQGSD